MQIGFMHRPRGIALFALLFLAGALTGWAQVYSGSLTGVVKDQSGAVIPGATVTLTDIGKQFDYTATTDDVGRYLLRALPPSTYKLKVEATGFSTHLQDGIVLAVNQNADVDVTLKVGAAAQTVEVTAAAAAALLATQDASTGQELNRRMINDLPLLGRGVFDLANLAPGVTPAPGNVGGTINFVSNGSRNSTADILMDGVSATSFEQNSGILNVLYTPSVDAVQEFKIQQSNFSAEIGFSGATIINVVTRSGTNEFHGSAWEFLRNNVLTANQWFNNANGVKLAPRRYNLFGATIGGPIRKQKTFFFFTYEGNRDVRARTYRAGVPSAAMRTGDFGEICTEGFDENGQCNGDGQLWDPYSGAYDESVGGAVRSRFVPYNRLDLYQSPGNPDLPAAYQPAARAGNLIDPAAKKMMSYFPMPNVNVGRPNYNPRNNWISSGSSRGVSDQWDIKIDHAFNDKNRLEARFARGTDSGKDANAFGNAYDPASIGSGGSHTHSFNTNFTHTFSPNTLMSVTLGFTRNFYDGKDIMTAYADVDPLKDLGLPSYLADSGFKASPAIVIQNYRAAAGNNIGSQAWGILRQSPEQYHLAGSWSHIRGRHDLKIGGEARMHRINFVQPCCGAGYYEFDQNGTSKEPWWQGDEMASFMTGFTGPNGWYGEYEIPAWASTQSFRYAGFVQDNWKITDKLTVNLGLRYDLETPRTERYDRMSYVDLNAASPVKAPGYPDLKGVLAFTDKNHRNNYGWDKNNWAPRFGFAYKLSEKTVLRGGYGVFYTITTRGAAGTGGYGFQGFDSVPDWMTSYHYDGVTPWGRLSDPFPALTGGIPPVRGGSLGAWSYVGQGIRGPFVGQNATPYEQTWTLGFQHELTRGIILEANYVGKKGTKLYFGGAAEINHLGPQIEKYSLSQIEDLQTYVPNPFYGVIDPNTGVGGEYIQKSQLSLPYPQFTGVSNIAPPVANSIYHAFQMRVEKRFSHGLQFLGTYTFSKSIDDASVSTDGLTWLGGTTSLQDPNNYRLERGPSEFDMTHVLGFSYIWELPFGRNRAIGKNWNPVVEAILGGWKTNGIWRFNSGQPIGLTLSGGINLPTYGGQRPNLSGTLVRNTGADWRDNYFSNPNVVSAPEPYALGTAPRTLGNVRNPGAALANMSLLKEFYLNSIREGMHLEFRAEFFNAFNHPQFGRPDTTWDGGNFGVIDSSSNAREIQMALKFYW